jgi:ATP-dependent RNA helicase DBP3
VTFFVLDEADRMLDMGFEREVRNIASLVSDNGERKGQVQTLMFSATWPLEIRKLAAEYLRSGDDVVRVTVGGQAGAADTGGDGSDGGDGGDADAASRTNSLGLRAGGPTASSSVTQHVTVLDDQRQKEPELLKLLKQFYSNGRNPRVIVFCLYKKEAARTEQMLQRRGHACVSLHGDMSQVDRTRAFESFRDGKSRLLVATDVAARGVDIPDVEYVVNYTFPLTIEDYVHRIGRTGRGNSRGDSYTFFTAEDKLHAGELVAVLRQANQLVPDEMNRFSLVIKKRADPLYGAFGPKQGLMGKKATKITFDDSD